MANKNLLKLRFLFYLLLAVCLFLIALKPAGRFLQIEDDLKELKGKASNKTIEYRSERGFGNDRLDIYSFTISPETVPNQFFSILESQDSFFKIQSDKDVKDRVLNLIDILPKNDPLRNKLENLCNEKPRFRYQSTFGTEKIYIINEGQEKGYCLISEI